MKKKISFSLIILSCPVFLFAADGLTQVIPPLAPGQAALSSAAKETAKNTILIVMDGHWVPARMALMNGQLIPVPVCNNPQPLPVMGVPDPWFDGLTLPTDDEKTTLLKAWQAAQADAVVTAAWQTYTQCFQVADTAMSAAMRGDPSMTRFIDPYNPFLLSGQRPWAHGDTWSVVRNFENSYDVFLPTPLASGRSENITVHYSNASSSSDTLVNARTNAQADPTAKAAMQKLRDAFTGYEIAVRTLMGRDAKVTALIEKYPFLFYGRSDLGLHAANSFFST